MSSPGQRRGLCGHIMAGYDKHKVCARCRDKKKGEDNCVKDLPCISCDVLTEEQKAKLATPQYQKKKEKREAKALEDSSTTLIDPSSVSVIGLASETEAANSEEMSTSPAGAKIKKTVKSSEAVSSTPEAAKAMKSDQTPDTKVTKGKSSKKRHSSPARSSAPSTDTKLEAMDLKWSKRFSRLEAMLLSKTISQPTPAFQSVKVTPVKPPPAGALDTSEPFFAPARSTGLSSTAQPASLRPHPDRPPITYQSLAGPVEHPPASTSGVEVTLQVSESDMDVLSDSDSESLPVKVDKTEEGELSDVEQDLSLTETDQLLSEEQNYRETMSGVRSFMGWTHIPEVDSALSSSEDNPFAAPKQQPTGQTSVNLPTDDWLCRKMDRLNVTLVQGYPSRSSETGGLQKDQFVKYGKSQGKWYGLHPGQDKPAGSVSFWHSEAAKLNSSFSRVSRPSGLTSPAPPSRTISQDTLRRWEKSAREATYICNQAAGLSRCVSKVQQSMASQLKILQSEHSKGKSADKVGGATEELQYLMTFNSSITQCMTKTMEHLSDFAFVCMYNFTLARRDSYLAHMKTGLKPDTLAALRQAPMESATLFPDTILKKAEDDISKFEERGHSHAGSSNRKESRYHPELQENRPTGLQQ